MKKYKLLIVDDNESILQMLEKFFERSNYEIRLAPQGYDAIKCINGGFSPDVILCDVVMPVLDGVGLANELVKMGSKAKIVFMSGNLGIHTIKELNQFTPHLLSKPFENMESLYKLIEQVMPS
ncbi:MAG: response regulator [Patescibacteria group bacterium]|nr:response regulator [Patescibacteria group bacterium]